MANKLYEEQDLQNIANSIRNKNNKSTTYKVSEMAAAINKLKNDPKPYKDVNFIDYDGTVLCSYSMSEALSLTQLPDNPTHEGLTAQGWNWDLADIQSCISDYGSLNIGQMYITDDSTTRLYIRVGKERKIVPLCFKQSVDRGVQVDWGDGSSVQTFNGTTTKILTSHTYSDSGDYVIKLKPANSCTLTLGGGDSQYCVLGENISSNLVYQNMLLKVEIGKNIVISEYAFQNCYSLSEITLPQYMETVGSAAFSYCFSLLSITLPKLFTSISSAALRYCYRLLNVIAPKNITTVENYAFQNCNALSNTLVLTQATSVGASAFRNCQSISKIIVSKDIDNIPAYAFAGCYGLKICDFSNHTQVPTMANTNAFSGILSDCQIIVPDSLYSAWISATNWSTYAGNIVKASEV